MTEVTITKPETETPAPKPARKGRPPGVKNKPKNPDIEAVESHARHLRRKVKWMRKIEAMDPEDKAAMREALLMDEPILSADPFMPHAQMPGISQGNVGNKPGNNPGNNPATPTPEGIYLAAATTQ